MVVFRQNLSFMFDLFPCVLPFISLGSFLIPQLFLSPLTCSFHFSLLFFVVTFLNHHSLTGKLQGGKANVGTPASADGKTMPQPPPPGLMSPAAKGNNNTGASEAGAGGEISGTPSGTAGSATTSASDVSSTSKPTSSMPSTTSKESHDADKPTNKDKDGTATAAGTTSEEQKPKTTLNPDAKEFKMSASAREFKPTFTIPPTKPVMPMQGQGGHGGVPSGPNNNMAMSGGPGMMPSSPMQQGQQGMGNVNGQMPRGGYTPPGQAQGMMQTNNGQMMVNPNNMQPMNMMSAQGGYVNNGQYPVPVQYNQYGVPMMPMMGGQPVMMPYGQGPPVNQANGNAMQPMGGMDVVQVGVCRTLSCSSFSILLYQCF